MINKILFFAAIFIFNNIALGNLHRGIPYNFDGYIHIYSKIKQLSLSSYHPLKEMQDNTFIIINSIINPDDTVVSNIKNCRIELKAIPKYKENSGSMLCFVEKQGNIIYSIVVSMNYQTPKTWFSWIFSREEPLLDNTKVQGIFTIKDQRILAADPDISVGEKISEHFKTKQRSQLSNYQKVCSEIRRGVFTNLNELLKSDSSLRNIKFGDDGNPIYTKEQIAELNIINKKCSN
jgi:hypothetical protein